jgi:MFS transporter, FSR family, fosmidomycin resistance protein
VFSVAATLLAIEFLDEVVFGARDAAMPAIRADLGLSYAQLGLALSLAALVSAAVEPLLGVLGDTRHRRAVMLAGGAAFAAGLVALAAARVPVVFVAAMCVLYPALGAFMSLSQATLMDMQEGRRDLAMNRWVIAGGLGVLGGPALVAASLAAGLGWRAPFAATAAAAAALVAGLRRMPVRAGTHGLRSGALATLRLLARRPILRGLALLELADLQLDVMHALLTVYLVDAAGMPAGTATLGLTVVAGVSLAGNLLLPGLLRRVPAAAYLRGSTLLTLAVYPAVLLVPSPPAKVAAATAVGVFTCGWYPLLKASLYDALPGQSGAATALSSASGTLAGLLPLGLGLLAARYGIAAAMWALLAGPVGLLLLRVRRL